jgi:hypothetical protein
MVRLLVYVNVNLLEGYSLIVKKSSISLYKVR